MGNSWENEFNVKGKSKISNFYHYAKTDTLHLTFTPALKFKIDMSLCLHLLKVFFKTQRSIRP